MTEPIKLAAVGLFSPRWNQLSVGDQVKLRRDPHNPHDANAIEVQHGTGMIGYIPRVKAAELAPQLDAGVVFKAQISEVSRTPGKKGIHITLTHAEDDPPTVPEELSLGF